ncbi:S-layer homology domain-containing protein [Psychrobacillus psychrodurans]|uniref:S-layer homology domain-containing protein n=1 Tax=Psychrobacillus psychrodurans TaxID=126157 RepID=A0A9X3L8G7_9BACI|nr:S-layer homology domain-containing protein [Psychrobacillus psychrodurans]MCZ8533330.1 S-layer homology domain-containing protein [Psychrobacillus psychrodurans]
MNKKTVINVLSATVIAASALTAAAPAQGASNLDALVQKAVNAGTVLKWAISLEGSADGTTRPYPEYNAAKKARDAAVVAVSKSPAAQKKVYMDKIGKDVNIHITRTMQYIDAITAGEKMQDKQTVLEAQIEKGLIVDETEKAYHELSNEIRKQAILLDRVYGKSTRDAIRDQYKEAAQDVRDSVMHAVTVKMKLDLADAALEANNMDEVEKYLAQANENIGQVQNAKMKATLIASIEAVEARLTPVVKSVRGANAKELVVVFNKAVNKTEAEKTANYSLEGEKFTKAVLSEDENTVTLTTEDELNVNNAKLSIAAIPTKADDKVKTEAHNTLFTFADKTAPVVASVEAKGTTAKITFAEPVQSEGTVSLNGAVTSNYTVSEDNKTVTITGLEAEKSYKVAIVGAKDYANNVANPISLDFTVEKPVVDEVKPSATVSVLNNEIIIDFTEEVTVGTVKINGTDYANKLVQDADDKTKYVLDAQTAGALTGVNFLNNAQIIVEGFKDKANNVGEKVSVTGTLKADKNAPSFVSANVNGNSNKILLTFDDAVSKGNLEAANELVLKVKDGVHQTNSVVDLTTTGTANIAYGYDLDGKDGVKGNEKNIVAIDYTLVKDSTYSFELAGKVVEDRYENQVADTLTFAVTGIEHVQAPAQPEATVVLSDVNVSGKVLTVKYNEDMSDSALVASNYKLGGKALTGDAQLKFVNDRKTVEITLPEGSITANGTYVFEVTSVTAKNGNTLLNNKATSTETLTENIAPVASNITVLNSKTFTVSFSETINDAAANTVTGVNVEIDGKKVTPASVSAVNGQLTVTTTADFALNAAISVEFNSTTNLVDANGNAVKQGIVSK